MHQKAIIIVSDGFAYLDGVAKGAKQAEPGIEIEDDLVIDDDDLDLIDCDDIQKYIIITVIYDLKLMYF